MPHSRYQSRGFSLSEALILVGILGISGTLVAVNSAKSETEARTQELHQNRALISEAIDSYRADHGWYPCDPARDWNGSGNPANLVRQLTEHTDAAGRPSVERTESAKFGPYLPSLPPEPVSGLAKVTVDGIAERTLGDLGAAAAGGEGRGGWRYEVRSGHVVADLGRSFPANYPRF